MVRRLLGGALAAFLIVSDRVAFIALALAAIALVRLLTHAPAEAAPVVRVKL